MPPLSAPARMDMLQSLLDMQERRDRLYQEIEEGQRRMGTPLLEIRNEDAMPSRNARRRELEQQAQERAERRAAERRRNERVEMYSSPFVPMVWDDDQALTTATVTDVDTESRTITYTTAASPHNDVGATDIYNRTYGRIAFYDAAVRPAPTYEYTGVGAMLEQDARRREAAARQGPPIVNHLQGMYDRYMEIMASGMYGEPPKPEAKKIKRNLPDWF